MANRYEIMTHGTSGRWLGFRECSFYWMDKPASTLDEALAVCNRIKDEGYGVCLFENGRIVLSAPWGTPVKVGLFGTIEHVRRGKWVG